MKGLRLGGAVVAVAVLLWGGAWWWLGHNSLAGGVKAISSAGTGEAAGRLPKVSSESTGFPAVVQASRRFPVMAGAEARPTGLLSYVGGTPRPILAGERQPLEELFSHNPPETAKPSLEQHYGRLPLYFTENRGQVAKQVKYYARGNGHTTFFTRQGLVLTLAQGNRDDGREAGRAGLDAASAARQEAPVQYSVVRLQPVGMQRKVKLKALQPQEGRVNYFIGNNPKKWRTGIPTYQAVVYEEAYRGIDLKFYGHGRQLEYDVVVKPGADPGQVRFAYEGVRELRVTAAGDLALVLPDGGELLQKKPYVYQEIAGTRVLREARFAVHQDGARLLCGFQVAAYDKAHSLVIDPVLVYSTYLGGSSDDSGYAIAVDAGGNACITGKTESTDFPLLFPVQGALKGSEDVFVTKLTAAGALAYSTYLGGGGTMNYERGTGIAVDPEGNAYITGETSTDDFPLAHPFQATRKGLWDAFVTKLTAEGSLAYSTYLGGSSWDEGFGIAADAGGNAYITGYTSSDDFPLASPFQGARKGGSDVFVTKLQPDGAGVSLAYSTYLGGSSSDTGSGIAVDSGGNAYITGSTTSNDFPLASPFQGTFKGEKDAFVTRLAAGGDALAYSTYLGGSDEDYGRGIAVDAGGNAYVTGSTYSDDFPLLNPFQGARQGNYDAFVTRLTAGGALAYSTYLGGGDVDYGYGIAVDRGGNAFITGDTKSNDFPTLNPFQGAIKGSYDAFVTKLTAAGNALAYSTYLGGSAADVGDGIGLDTKGNAYIAGHTVSGDFPTLNPFQGALKGGFDAFVTKISPGSNTPTLPLLLFD